MANITDPQTAHLAFKMPSATGQNWEKYKKEFADDEEPEKKITPLTDEYDTMELLSSDRVRLSLIDAC